MKVLYTCFSLSLLSLLAFVNVQVLAQTNGSISGVVKTSDGNPASFVNVSLKELRKGTTTSEDGAYQLKNISPGSYILQ